MTDYSELKRLAEAANAVTSDVNVEMTLASESGPNQAEIDAVTAFMGMATPAAVLALIAENERLATQVRLAGVSAEMTVNDAVGRAATEYLVVAQERDQLKAENAGLKTGYEAYEQVVKELKAEVEALRQIVSDCAKSCGAAVSVECSLDFMAQLPVEIFSVISRLRNRIADMSPFKGAPLTGPDTRCLACGGYHYGISGLPCPNMRVTASAALSKGEQS